MLSQSDPHRRFQRLLVPQVGACWLLASLAAAWAWWVPRPADHVVSVHRDATAAGAPASAPVVETALWDIELWRPFVDEAPPSAPAAPLALKLYSILKQGDALIAAIAIGDSGSLVYLEAGDTADGFTVLRVEADGVVLRVDGRERRLELGP